MSAQVDVNAILEACEAYVDDAASFPEHFKPGLVKRHQSQYRKARAAVAALIAERDVLREALSQKVNDAEQRAFEDWLESKSPSGDHDEVQWKWMESHDYRDFIDEWREQIDALTTGESA